MRWIRNTFFPIRDAQGQIRRAGGIAQDITRHEGRFVYVVDGDETSRQDLTRLLRDAGYRVRAFPSGKAFLEAAPALVAGCVVLDICRSGARRYVRGSDGLVRPNLGTHELTRVARADRAEPHAKEDGPWTTIA